MMAPARTRSPRTPLAAVQKPWTAPRSADGAATVTPGRHPRAALKAQAAAWDPGDPRGARRPNPYRHDRGGPSVRHKSRNAAAVGMAIARVVREALIMPKKR